MDKKVGPGDSMNGATDIKGFFRNAPGGTCNNFLINTIQAYLKRNGKKIVAVKTSALATTLLWDGKTAH